MFALCCWTEILLVEIKGIDDHFVQVLSNYCEKLSRLASNRFKYVTIKWNIQITKPSPRENEQIHYFCNQRG